jgi:adenylate kinase family enzyme
MAATDARELAQAHRILCYGVTGSGKSTAALRLGRLLGLPVHLVDEEIGWLPATEAPWTLRPADDQLQIAAELAARDAWVVDSAYSTYLPVLLERAEVVVALDLSRVRTFARLTRRSLARVIDRRQICNGNVETIRQLLGRDSILRWHAQSFSRKRARMRSWEADPDGPQVVRISNPRQWRALLADLAQHLDRTAARPNPARRPQRRRT